MVNRSNVTTPVNLMTRISNCLPLNKRKPSGKNVRQQKDMTMVNTTNVGTTRTKMEDLTKDQAIGKRNQKRKDHKSSAQLCLSSKILAPSFLHLPSRTTLHQPRRVCPHPSWEVETHRTEGTKAAKPNDCLSMQFIHQPNLSTQIQLLALRHNLGRGLSQPMKLIPMQMRVALVTTSSSSNSPLGVWMCAHMTSP